jgi:hypothetical protein
MTTSNEAIYPQGIRNFAAKATAAKTTMTDTTNAVLLVTAGANGSLVKRCRARANGASADSVLYLFTCVDGGSTLHMKEVMDAPVDGSVSTTVAQQVIDMGPSEDEPMRLSPLEKLYCAASVALAAGWEFEGDLEDL